MALGSGENKMGDDELRHLGAALARGAAPALETLDLRQRAEPFPPYLMPGWAYLNNVKRSYGNASEPFAPYLLMDWS
jgi:hypothetical protein